MSKAEKFKKIYKKVLNWVIPIVIISVVIGAILVIPKYYNKGGGTIETVELTVSPSYNWEILAAKIAGGLFLAILILVLIVNSRRKSSKSVAGVGKFKMSYGKVWNWVIPIVIVSAIIGGILIVPKYYNKGGNGIGGVKSGFYSWKKLDDQYGYNPDQRSAGPFKARITLNSEKLSFEFSTRVGMCYFEGWKDGDKFKGKWRCPNTGDGGDWELKEDLNKKGFYVGLEKEDSDLPEGKPSELIILN